MKEIFERRSIRKYENNAIPMDLIKKMRQSISFFELEFAIMYNLSYNLYSKRIKSIT